MHDRTSSSRPLPVILIAAVIQGWGLFLLHTSVEHSVWPATAPGWLLGLYVLAIAVPMTVQMNAEHARGTSLWPLLSFLSVLGLYFGWNYGVNIFSDPIVTFDNFERVVPAGLVLAVLWLLILPFLQARLDTGRWRAPYAQLFAIAWRNKLVFAEAALFTVLFCLLLVLWAGLFSMLGVKFFAELFRKPLFIYPVVTMTFGIGLHLIGNAERLTAALLTQVLGVLKWLAIVAGILLATFTVTLVFKLPALVFEGRRAIGAVWLLWLVAVVVLLLNAAYRDGQSERPYPAVLGHALRFTVPLTVVVAVTAVYALFVRAGTYGLTVERVWACIVAGSALLYAIGYSISAFRAGRWLHGMGQVNVVVAVILMAVIAAAMTPVLSPYRLAANSQYRNVLESQPGAVNDIFREPNSVNTAFHSLAFDTGLYGRQKLEALTALQDHPQAERIRTAARRMLQLESRYVWSTVSPEEVVADIEVFPNGRSMDAALRQQLLEELKKDNFRRRTLAETKQQVVGVFANLHGDATDEFVLLHDSGAAVFEFAGGAWRQTLRVDRPRLSDAEWDSLVTDLKANNFTVSQPEWKDLVIGSRRYRVEENR